MPPYPQVAEHLPLVIGRYAIYDRIASGGMATVHLGRLVGEAGFHRTVAIKRLHPQYAHDEDFTTMFLDEARLVARIQHPNVVPTLDVVVNEGELLIVMEYVRGVSLAQLTKVLRERDLRLPPPVAVAIVLGALHGLHAAHEAADERGAPLNLVHRDVSPQNILVSVDGTPRVLDFGVAKASGRAHSTRDGEIKGKLLYMAPEQLAAEPVSRTADVYAAGIVLFETLTSVRMFAGEAEAAAVAKIICGEIRVPSAIDPALARFDPIVRRACSVAAAERYKTAREMALALEATMTPASAAEVGTWVERLTGDLLEARAAAVREIESASTKSRPPAAPASQRRPRLPDTGVSEIGTVTAASTTASLGRVGLPSRRPRAAVGVVVAMGLLLLGALTVIFALLRRPPTVVQAVSQGSGAADLVASAPQPHAQTAAPTETATAQVPTASAKPSAEVASTPASAPRPTAVPASGPRDRAPKPSGAQAPKRANCDPPYVTDEKGHRHFLPECVQ